MYFTANIQDAEITSSKIEAICSLKDDQMSRGHGHPTQVQGSHTSASFMDSAPVLTGTLCCFQKAASMLQLPAYDSVHTLNKHKQPSIYGVVTERHDGGMEMQFTSSCFCCSKPGSAQRHQQIGFNTAPLRK